MLQRYNVISNSETVLRWMQPPAVSFRRHWSLPVNLFRLKPVNLFHLKQICSVLVLSKSFIENWERCLNFNCSLSLVYYLIASLLQCLKLLNDVITVWNNFCDFLNNFLRVNCCLNHNCSKRDCLKYSRHRSLWARP